VVQQPLSTLSSLERKPGFASAWSSVDLPKLLSQHQAKINEFNMSGNVDAIHSMEVKQAEDEHKEALLYDKENLKRKKIEYEDAKAAKNEGVGLHAQVKRRKIDDAETHRRINEFEHKMKQKYFGNTELNKFCIFTRYDSLPKDYAAGETVCIICHDQLASHEQLAIYPACGHYSHQKCAKKWYDDPSHQRRCTICSTDFQEDRLANWQSSGIKVVSNQVQQIEELQAQLKALLAQETNTTSSSSSSNSSNSTRMNRLIDSPLSPSIEGQMSALNVTEPGTDIEMNG
jgi:hypothetical protein